MIRGMSIALIFTLISGCVGLGSYTKTQFRSSQPFSTVMNKPQNQLPINKIQLLAAWGEPNAKRQEDYREVWTYAGKGDLAWRGIVIWVLLPIPLLLPVGNNDVEITFDKDGVLKSVYLGEVDATFYGCNIGFVCQTFHNVTHFNS